MRLSVGVVLLVVACSSKKPSSTGGSGSASSTETAAKDPCSAQELGLTGPELPTWVPSNGCDLRPAPSPTLLTNLDAVGAAIDCDAMGGGGPPLTFNGPVVVTSRSFSPAQTGLKAFDDGTTVTFVSVQRSPCPNDPRPMPGPMSNHAFGPLASGGSRAFAERACTVPARCP